MVIKARDGVLPMGSQAIHQNSSASKFWWSPGNANALRPQRQNDYRWFQVTKYEAGGGL
jgi:histidinol phosphatase-like enzyme